MKIRKQTFRAFHKADNKFSYHGDLMAFQLMDGVWKLDDWAKNAVISVAKDCGYIFTQSVGILDVTGKDIYEGDFVKIKRVNMEGEHILNDKFAEKNMIFKIEWDEFYCAFKGQNTKDENHDIILGQYEFEIVGNVFQNKELLREKEYVC